MKNIVTIGGGTGHLILLRSLKNYNIHLTAIVSVSDSGGSTGKLREEFVDFGILPPGDIRNCLLALTDESKLHHMVKLFEHRFPKTKGGLSKHNLGNLILTAAQHIYGKKGIQIVADMLGIKDTKVLPISPDPTTLYAKTNKKILKGQINVSYPDKNIQKIWLEPVPFIYKEAAKALKSADLIIICPGDLYGSILPNLLVKGVDEAIKQSQAKIIYICNLVTKQGSQNFKASDFVKEIEKYLPRKIDFVICNTKKPAKDTVDKYKYENSYFVEPDINGEHIIKEELLTENKIGNRIIARHNSEKTARLIMEFINNH